MLLTTFIFAILCIISQNIDADQFVDVFVDNTTPFVNEQVTYTFRYYHENILPTLEEPKYLPPLFTGFLKIKLPSTDTKFQVVNGVTYRVEEIKTALFPVSVGRHEIKPASFYIPSFSADFDQAKTLTTSSIELLVRPLPEEGKPWDFSGVVGKYQILAKTDKTTVSVGQPITLAVVLSGVGNIKACVQPDIPKMNAFEKYKPTRKWEEKKSVLISGYVRWEYVLIAQRAGNYTIPSIGYNYFNPETGIYESIRTRPIFLVVDPGASNNNARDDLTQVGNLCYKNDGASNNSARDDLSNKNATNHFYQRIYFWVVVILPVLIAVGTIILKKSVRRIKDTPGYLRKDAAKVADKRLQQMEHLIDSRDAVWFSTELAKTIRKYISIQLDILVTQLNTDQISSRMIESGYSAVGVIKLSEVLERCDYVRFAPTNVNSKEMRKILQSARSAIRLLN